MASIEEIVKGMEGMKERLMLNRLNRNYRETVEALYAEKVEVLRRFPDQSIFQGYKEWLIEYQTRYPMPSKAQDQWLNRPA